MFSVSEIFNFWPARSIWNYPSCVGALKMNLIQKPNVIFFNLQTSKRHISMFLYISIFFACLLEFKALMNVLPSKYAFELKNFRTFLLQVTCTDVQYNVNFFPMQFSSFLIARKTGLPYNFVNFQVSILNYFTKTGPPRWHGPRRIFVFHSRPLSLNPLRKQNKTTKQQCYG